MATKKGTTQKEEKSLPEVYAARLEIDYPEKLDRGTTFLRLFWIIPIAIILGLITGSGETVTNTVFLNEAGEIIRRTQETAGGSARARPLPATSTTATMILWWSNIPGAFPAVAG